MTLPVANSSSSPEGEFGHSRRPCGRELLCCLGGFRHTALYARRPAIAQQRRRSSDRRGPHQLPERAIRRQHGRARNPGHHRRFRQPGGISIPPRGAIASDALIGYFYDPPHSPEARALPDHGQSAGVIDRQDVKYNPVSHEYDVVVNARAAFGQRNRCPDDRPGQSRFCQRGPTILWSKVFVYDGLRELPLPARCLTTTSPSRSAPRTATSSSWPSISRIRPAVKGAFGALFGPDGTVLTATPGAVEPVATHGRR